MVEDIPAALLAVAVYIDLNPVRAGLVKDPKDYRFRGYGEAAGTKGGLEKHPLFVHLAERHTETVAELAAT